jgi:hypothetical protein
MPYTPPASTLGLREDLFSVTLLITPATGSPVTVIVDKMKGGASQGKDVKYRPANGLENQLSLGGPRTVENITLTRIFDETINNFEQFFHENAGKAKATVTRQPLDADGNAHGKAIIYEGRFLDFKSPDIDSEADKAAMAEWVVSPESKTSAGTTL